jgi:hypothetical protein
LGWAGLGYFGADARTAPLNTPFALKVQCANSSIRLDMEECLVISYTPLDVHFIVLVSQVLPLIIAVGIFQGWTKPSGDRDIFLGNPSINIFSIVTRILIKLQLRKGNRHHAALYTLPGQSTNEPTHLNSYQDIYGTFWIDTHSAT